METLAERSRATAADMAFMIGLRVARQDFFVRLAGMATDGSAFEDLLDRQRDAIFVIAEFLFAVRGLDADAVTALMTAHNDHLDGLIAAKYDGKVGGRANRMREGRFPKSSFQLVKFTWNADGGELSQSDIARFLVEVSSAETCRTALTGLAEAGLLRVRDEPLTAAKMIGSDGHLEGCFGQYLADIRARAR